MWLYRLVLMVQNSRFPSPMQFASGDDLLEFPEQRIIQ